MKTKHLLKIMLRVPFLLALPSSIVLSSTLSKPNNSDIESTCRTLLYQVTKEKGNNEKIIVLDATYKMICQESTDTSELVRQKFTAIGQKLENRTACLSTSGFLATPVGGTGFTHRELEKIFNISPYIKNLTEEEMTRFTTLTKSGFDLKSIEQTIPLLKLKEFKKKQVKIEELNQQIKSLNLEQFSLDKIQR